MEPTPEMLKAFQDGFAAELHQPEKRRTMTAEAAGLRAMLNAAPAQHPDELTLDETIAFARTLAAQPDERGALRELLEVVEARNSQGGGFTPNAEAKRRIDSARALLAAPAPAQPVAWRYRYSPKGTWRLASEPAPGDVGIPGFEEEPLYAAPPQEAQPEPTEAELVCYEAYQVVGSLLSDLDKFDTPEAEKILDNLSQAKLVHKDVLPWASYGAQEAQHSLLQQALEALELSAPLPGSEERWSAAINAIYAAPQEAQTWSTELRGGKPAFTIGVQTFTLDYDDSEGTAEWMRTMLEKALARLARGATPSRPSELQMLGYELDGVLADVEHGQGGRLDSVCILTLQRVSARLHAMGAAASSNDQQNEGGQHGRN